MRKYLLLIAFLSFVPFVLAGTFESYDIKATPEAGDYGLLLDSDDGVTKRFDVGDLGGSGEGINWTAYPDLTALTSAQEFLVNNAGTSSSINWAVVQTQLPATGWTDGGTNVYTTTTTDNVGIGTTNPSSKLQVVGKSNVKTSSDQETAPLGAELLTGSGWTSAGWTGSFPTFTHTAGNTSALSYTVTGSASDYHYVYIIVAGRTAGSFSISFGGESGISSTITTSLSWGPYVNPSSGNLIITPTSDFDGSLTVSVKIIGTKTAVYDVLGSDGSVSFEMSTSPALMNNTFVGLNNGKRVDGIRGNDNACVGSGSCAKLTTGYDNACFGKASCSVLTTGYENTVIGQGALLNSRNAYNMTVMGLNAARSTGAAPNNSIYIGSSAGYGGSQVGELSGVIVIGNGQVYADEDSQMVLGSTAIDETYIGGKRVGIGTTNPRGALVVMNGNVGVGTWSPTQKLQVLGTVSMNSGSIGSASTYRAIAAPTDGLQVQGNVGIGTWSPVAKLQVVGTVIFSSATSSVTVKSGADTACNTTCAGSMNIWAQNTADMSLVNPTNAAADVCGCLGP